MSTPLPLSLSRRLISPADLLLQRWGFFVFFFNCIPVWSNRGGKKLLDYFFENHGTCCISEMIFPLFIDLFFTNVRLHFKAASTGPQDCSNNNMCVWRTGWNYGIPQACLTARIMNTINNKLKFIINDNDISSYGLTKILVTTQRPDGCHGDTH